MGFFGPFWAEKHRPKPKPRGGAERRSREAKPPEARACVHLVYGTRHGTCNGVSVLVLAENQGMKKIFSPFLDFPRERARLHHYMCRAWSRAPDERTPWLGSRLRFSFLGLALVFASRFLCSALPFSGFVARLLVAERRSRETKPRPEAESGVRRTVPFILVLEV